MERKTAFSEKTGLKRGSWSLEEDMKLTAYIKRYGHWNWRELPKFAGLSRCGKSCRLRWMNYLRPDIKRGNFTKEEEEIIINLHESFGNRWSAIAAKLPGRTDNEIKNHWHTHLKKSFKKNRTVSKKAKVNSIKVSECKADKERESEANMYLNCATHPNSESSSSLSSKDSITFCNGKVTDSNGNLMETLEELDTSFWTEPFIVGDSFTQEKFIENLYPFGFYSDDCTDYFSNQLIPVELFDLY